MSLRVALRPAAFKHLASPTARALLSRAGARVVLGTLEVPAAQVAPVRPSATSLFGPRGAVLADREGPLVVCDTGHHRLVLWRRTPPADGEPADLVIGQPSFENEGRNAGGGASNASLNVPTGVAAAQGVMAVADAWNHRVLLWYEIPQRSNQPADVVLGQADFVSNLPNRGLDRPGADTLNWCYGVAIHGEKLFVADTGNRRVLVWNELPKHNGASADIVLGQPNFWARDEGAGSDAGPAGMRWPHAIAAARENLFVADAGMSRVMAWRSLSALSNGAACDLVLGQADVGAHAHNGGHYEPTASVLNMPYGIYASHEKLIVADTANSRLLGFAFEIMSTGAAATTLAAQPSFEHRGDNRWSRATRDSVCWPYGVSVCGATVIVADSGNNRVLLWDLA
jgi:hypothetical protein